MDDMHLTFRLFREDEMLKLSVARITSASTYDHGLPKTGGLMDSRMGSTDRSILCQTCHSPMCSGHYGHIALPCRVLLPGHIKRIVSLLRCVCHCCCTKLFTDDVALKFSEGERLKAVSEVCRKVSECAHCKAPVPETAELNKLFLERKWTPEQLKAMDPEEKAFLTARFVPDEAWSIIDKISTETLVLLGMHPETSHPRDTLPNTILVLPPAQRPTLRIADGGKSKGEDDLTSLYQDIIRASLEYDGLSVPKKPRKTEPDAFGKLQLFVACLVKNAFRKSVDVKGVVDHGAARGIVRTLRDLDHRLSGKKGRLRGTLNAKRTDFSARTVVGIDMTHDIWQLGVPKSRMSILTFPERVTNLNIEVLRERVRIGSGHNGAANIIQPIMGGEQRVILLSLMTQMERIACAESLEIGWIVERHLKDGDWVLFNRQPTLHKMSIQGFEIYGIEGLTFRLPLPVTRPFNADYDGDEMNMHVPQSIDAVAEAQQLMAVPFNMVSPSSTAAIIAPVQETLVAWFRMTSRDVLISRDSFQQLMAQISYDPSSPDYAQQGSKGCFLPVPQPAIIKSPKGPLWTGKQLLSCVLPKSISSTRAVRDGKLASDWMGHREDVVVISRGQLLLGRICKATIGGGTSLVHTLWKDVGPWAAAKFVSDVQRIGNAWAAIDSPCISIRDCIVPQEIEEQVDDLVSTAMVKADEVETLGVPKEIKEGRIAGLLQDVLRSAGSLVLKSLDVSSALATVVVSGSKGNALNLSQIAAVVGQQTIAGKRVQARDSRLGPRTLVCFPPGDTRPEAAGFVATSYLSGQTEDEFFHCMMAGREGIVATATDTATAGYNTRKMVKIQEGQIVAQDHSVRVTGAAVVTLHYGGDDYDACHVESVRIPALRMTRAALSELGNISILAQAQSELRKLCTPLIPGELASSVTLPFNPVRLNDEMVHLPTGPAVTQTEHATWLQRVCNDVCGAHGYQGCSFSRVDDGSWKKSVCAIILTWTWAACSRFSATQLEWLRTKLLDRVHRALIAPGEAVGTISGTSIGEPSTQGALNVFHFSGIAEKNALAGMPRFKQLINATRSDETSMMSILCSANDAPSLCTSLKSIRLDALLASSRVVPCADPVGPLQVREAVFLPLMSAAANDKTCTLAKPVQAALGRTELSASDSYAVHYILDKRKCHAETITPQPICARLRSLMGSTALVLASEEFEREWVVRIVPFGVSVFMVNGIFDSRAVCEALLDTLRVNCLVRGIPGVSESFVSQTTIDAVGVDGGIARKSHVRVGTLGSSLYAASWLCPDPSKMWTNDVLETAELLGIEAATLLNHSELQRVISFDSTHVDARHTLLLSETMTRCGSVAALNRHKMKDLGSSLLSRASFEQTLPVLEDAAFFSQKDALDGSLERQIVGLPLRLGTGAVTIIPLWKEPVKEVIVLAPLQVATRNLQVAPLTRLTTIYETQDVIAPVQWNVGWTPHVSAPCSSTLVDASARVKPIAELWWKTLTGGIFTILRATSVVLSTPSTFSKVLKLAESYHGWEDADSPWVQTTRVTWTLDERTVYTVVVYPTDKSVGKCERIHVSKTAPLSAAVTVAGQPVTVSSWCISPLHASFVPESVAPKSVTVRQRRTFTRDGWRMTFTRSWTSPSMLESEAMMLTSDPVLSCTIDAISSAAGMHALPTAECLMTKVSDVLCT